MAAHKTHPQPHKAAPDPKADAARPSRFVQEGLEGILIDGVPVEEYLARPEVQRAVAAQKAAGAGTTAPATATP